MTNRDAYILKIDFRGNKGSGRRIRNTGWNAVWLEKKGKAGKNILYCFDAAVLGLSMANNMRAELCVQTQ